MLTQDLIDYYAKLLILQYRGKAKAFAHIQTIVGPVIMDQLPIAVRDAFNIDDAEGTQLDVIGKYVGVSRDQRDFSGLVTLDDDNYRLLIKIKIIQNYSGSSLSDIQDLIALFFDGQMRVFDHKNMHMDYFLDSNVGTNQLAEIFVRGGFLPKPMGVQLAALVYYPAAPTVPFFGFGSYELAAYGVSGFNNYSSYDMAAPWLSYGDAIAL